MSDRPHFEDDTIIEYAPMSSRNTKSFTRDVGNSSARITVQGEFTYDVIDELHNRGLEPVKITMGTLVTTISSNAIVSCPELTTIYVSPTVEYIYEGAIQSCPKLATTEIYNDTISLDIYCINNCPCVIDSEKGYYHVDNCVIAPNNPSGELDLTGMRIIGDGVFSDQSNITSVVFGDDVTSIGARAFQNCTGLTSVTIPDNVTNIGYSAFSDCSGLTSVTIPNSVTTIGASAFYNCQGLTSVTIPNSVTDIGDSAFFYCNSLTSVTFLDKSLQEVQEMENYSWGIEDTSIINVEQPAKTVFTLNNGTVEEYDIVGTIDVDWLKANGYRDNNTGAFLKNITHLKIGNTVATVGNDAFGACESLSNITIPDSVLNIEAGAFQWCVNLTDVIIPDSVTTIGNSAFCHCDSLKTVTIGSGLANMGEDVFIDYRDLTTFVVDENNANYKSVNRLLLSKDGTTLIAGVIGDVIIPDGVTSIKNNIFSYSSGLTSITIPNSVASIEGDAFYLCSNLTNVTFLGKTLEQVQGMENYSWGIDDTSIINVQPVAPNGKVLYKTSADGEWLQSDANIKNGAFNGFNEKSSSVAVIIPSKDINGNDVTTIGEDAFSMCRVLTGVTIPDSVTGIGGWAFEGCNNLTGVTIPDSVTSIEESAFNGCGLISVITPNSVISIGNYAFTSCTNLTSMTIGNGVTNIGEDAFDGCSKLTSVTFIGKTLEQVQAMTNYSWGIDDTSIINVQS